MQEETITFLSRKGEEKRRIVTESSLKAEVGLVYIGWLTT